MVKFALAIIIVALASFIFLSGVSAIENTMTKETQDSLITKLRYLESERRISEREARKMRVMLDEHQDKGVDLGLDYDSLAGENNYHVLRGCHLRDSIMAAVGLLTDK